MPLLRVEYRHPELLDYIGISYGLSMTDLRFNFIIITLRQTLFNDLLGKIWTLEILVIKYLIIHAYDLEFIYKCRILTFMPAMLVSVSFHFVTNVMLIL